MKHIHVSSLNKDVLFRDAPALVNIRRAVGFAQSELLDGAVNVKITTCNNQECLR